MLITDFPFDSVTSCSIVDDIGCDVHVRKHNKREWADRAAKANPELNVNLPTDKELEEDIDNLILLGLI